MKGERDVTDGFAEARDKVRAFLEEEFAGRYEIYDLSLKNMNKRLVLQVFIDSPEGIKVQDCENVSRALSRFLDETDPIHCTYTLEVSSPGAERVFKRQVDYERHIGKMVRWALKSDEGKGREVFQARLHEFSPDRIVVQIENALREFPLAKVAEARAVLEFPRKPRG